MGEGSKISWTHHTFNPWWGCQRVSPGCGLGKDRGGCYAEAFAKRVGLQVWGQQAPRRFFGDKHWTEPLKWHRDAKAAGERRRVFCASMADWAEDRPDLVPHRMRLWKLIAATRDWLDWLMLTKRPENIGRLGDEVLEHCWVGTTAENQKYADIRTAEILKHEALLHWLSLEPLLGPIDLDLPRCETHDREFVGTGDDGDFCTECAADGWSGELSCGHWLDPLNGGISWIVAGGESGPAFRTCEVEWFASIAEQCEREGVAFFMKQDCGLRNEQQGRIPDELWARKQFPEVRHG